MDIHDPLKWYSFQLDVTGPWTLFQALPYGWMLTFLRVPFGPSAPQIMPGLIPTDGQSGAPEAWSLFLQLPESGGDKEYCLTIIEAKGWAQLQTAEWTVIVLKAPGH